jgi:copper(I)-binding protein
MLRSALTTFALTTLLLSMVIDAAAADGLRAEDPWIPAAPPSARMMAGYMTIVNDGEAAVEIVDARAAGFGRVEIHRSYREDGMMRMRRIEVLDVPAGGSARLERGGLHIMLMAPERVPGEGETVTIDLLDVDGNVVLSAPAAVERR